MWLEISFNLYEKRDYYANVLKILKFSVAFSVHLSVFVGLAENDGQSKCGQYTHFSCTIHKLRK